MVKLQLVGAWTEDELVLLVAKEKGIKSMKAAENIHKKLNNNSRDQMLYAFKNAGKLDNDTRKNIEKVMETCKICRKKKSSSSKSSETVPRATNLRVESLADLELEEEKEADTKEKELRKPEKDERQTRVEIGIERREPEKDQTAAFWLQMEDTACDKDTAIFAVEVLRKEHEKPEILEAKEIEKLEKDDGFEETDNDGQETRGSRRADTKKEKSDGRKDEDKAANKNNKRRSGNKTKGGEGDERINPTQV